jgi:hypothetical protein
MSDENIDKFIEMFFKNVGAKIEKKRGMYVISNIPLEVQEYLGKKEPYHLALENSLELHSNAELITKGSFFLKNMNDYLKQKGQTTLLKIDFSNKIDDKMTIPIVLKEGELYKQEKKEVVDFIEKFSFITYFQYLNEKEQIMNEIIVKDGREIKVDLGKYSLIEGENKNLNLKEIKKDYEFAKESLKEKLTCKIEKISKKLEKKLEKEISRIDNHYLQQQKEINDGLIRLQNQLKEAEKNNDKKRIDRINLEINQIKIKKEKSQVDIEKNFFIQDESNKHALNVNTKLFNTTVIYFPSYVFTIYLKNKKSIRALDIEFDPFNDRLSEIYCDSCTDKLREIYLCSFGHCVCKECVKTRCSECNCSICNLCLIKECSYCRKSLCRKCGEQCAYCMKKVCSNHIHQERGSQKMMCFDCALQCSKCKNWFNKLKLRKNNEQNICEACYRISFLTKSSF